MGVVDVWGGQMPAVLERELNAVVKTCSNCGIRMLYGIYTSPNPTLTSTLTI